jgi:hypothetical protein
MPPNPVFADQRLATLISVTARPPWCHPVRSRSAHARRASGDRKAAGSRSCRRQPGPRHPDAAAPGSTPSDLIEYLQSTARRGTVKHFRPAMLTCRQHPPYGLLLSVVACTVQNDSGPHPHRSRASTGMAGRGARRVEHHSGVVPVGRTQEATDCANQQGLRTGRRYLPSGLRLSCGADR